MTTLKEKRIIRGIAQRKWEKENPYLHAHLKYVYHKRSGILTNRKTGKQAGTIDKNGYVSTSFTSELSCGVHRIAFLMMKGRWPIIIDHINHIRHDNRWKNLREVTAAQNNQSNKYKTSKTGIVGVTISEANNYIATINHNGKTKHLGTYKTKLEAAIARMKAEIQYGYYTGEHKSTAFCYVKHCMTPAPSTNSVVEA